MRRSSFLPALLASTCLTTAAAYAGGSTIDPTVPAAGSAMSSATIRNNFAAAYNDINNVIQAYRGPTAPATPLLYTLWADTSASPTVFRRWDGAQWVAIGQLDTANHTYNSPGSIPLDPRQPPYNLHEDGVSDDTAGWQSVDTAVCSMNPKPAVIIAKPSAVQNWHWHCISKLIAYPGAGFVMFPAGATTTTELMQYEGTGPMEIDGVTFTCPIYDFASLARPNCDNVLELEPATNTVQTADIVIRNSTFRGGSNGVLTEQVNRVRVENSLFDHQWNIGTDVDASVADVSVATGNAIVKNNLYIMPGGYAATVFSDSNTAPNNAGSIAEVTGNVAIGCGFIQGKFCFDITGHSMEMTHFDNVSYDASAGGVELKRTGLTAASMGIVPYTTMGQFSRINYITHIDTGTCLAVAYEMAQDVARGLRSRFTADADCSYMDPAPWTAGAGILAGWVRFKGGIVYQAQNDGLTGSTGPSGTGNGLPDGTVKWASRGSLPANQGVVGGVVVGGAAGSGEVVGEELTVSGGSCVAPPVLAPLKTDNGMVIMLKTVFEGQCTAPPPNPVTLTGGVGGPITANLTWHYEPGIFVVAQLNASNNVELHLHSNMSANGVLLLFEGDQQLISNARIYFDGIVEASCIEDQEVTGTEFGDQMGYGDHITFIPRCTSLGGTAAGAIYMLRAHPLTAWSTYGVTGSAASPGNYFQNDVVTNDAGKAYIAQCDPQSHPLGCKPGNTGGPTGTGLAIPDGTDTLHWNFSNFNQIQATYNDFEISNGFVEAQGTIPIFSNAGTAGFLQGTIHDMDLRGGTKGFLVTQSAALTMWSDRIALRRSAAAISLSPIVLSGTGADQTIQLLDGVSVQTNETTSNSNFAGVTVQAGATGAVKGYWTRGTVGSNISGIYSCSPQDLWQLYPPTASGWVYLCTGPGTGAASVFTLR